MTNQFVQRCSANLVEMNSSVDDLENILKIMTSSMASLELTIASLNTSYEAHIRYLQMQTGQLTNAFNNLAQEKVKCKVMTTRSGRVLEENVDEIDEKIEKNIFLDGRRVEDKEILEEKQP